MIFSVASPIRIKDPYKGYVQVLIGEPEVVWGALARTPAHRIAAQEAAFKRLNACAGHYVKHSIKIADGPLGKLLEAMDDPWGLATLEEAMLWLKKLKTFVAKHPTLNKVWFVRDLDLKPLADHIKDAHPSE